MARSRVNRFQISKELSPLFVQTTNPPSMQVEIYQGNFYLNEEKKSFAGGNSATIVAPSTNNRIDIIVLDENATVQIIQGVEAASPVTPEVPQDVIPLAQITLATTTTSIGQDLISDFRPTLNIELDPLLVSQKLNPEMKVEISAGIYYLNSVRKTFAGGDTATITAPSTNDRIDIITLTESNTLDIIEGTEAASPSEPTVPSENLELASIALTPGQTFIDQNDITDLRPVISFNDLLNVSSSVAGVSGGFETQNLLFDSDSGFSVSNEGDNTTLVSGPSLWNSILVDGATGPVADGLDNLYIFSGNNITVGSTGPSGLIVDALLSQGETGVSGDPGSQGNTGLQGITGLQGPAGEGGGSGFLSVLDEGTGAFSASAMDFIGTDVSVLQDPSDINKALVYIPSVTFSPFYNVGAASVSGPSTSSRYVAAPTSEGTPFKIGDWTGGTLHPSTRTTSLSFDADDVCSFVDDSSSTIEVKVFDADGTSVLATKTTPGITGNYDDTSDNIRIRVTNWAAEFIKYVGRILVTVTIGSILPNSGRFKVQVTHNNGIDGTYTYTGTDIFFDDEPTTQTISGVTIAENTVSSSMYLSGIRYYDTGDSFDIGVTDMDNLNANTYPSTLLSINSSGEYGIVNDNLGSGDLTSWTNIHNDTNTSYTETKTITSSNFRYIGTAANISGQVHDWTSGASANSANASICIDTYNTQSSDLAEYFTDETYRRTSADAAWVSTSDMTSYDDNKGMMVQEGVLKTQRTDWTSYAPGTTGNPDYSGFSGAGTYYRRFTDTAQEVHGSAQMTISGFTLQNLIDEDVKIWLLIPTRWSSECFLHGSSTFDFGSFNGDNDPIRTDDSTSSVIKFSFGTLGMNSTYDYFIMHMEITSSSINPSSIVVSF